MGQTSADQRARVLQTFRKDQPAVRKVLSQPRYYIPTGCATVDAILRGGGLPTGRMSVICGDFSSGKSTFCQHICAEVQAMGGIAIYYDIDRTLDEVYARALGINWDELEIRPRDDEDGNSTPEEYLEAVLEDISNSLKTIAQEAPDIPIAIIVDDINTLMSKEEYEAGFTDEFYGPRAKVYSRILPKLVPILSRSSAALIFISQIRDKVGGGRPGKIRISGGNAPRFHASVAIELIPFEFKKQGEDPVGSVVKAKTIKNKLFPPFQEAEYEIRWGTGIDKIQALVARASVFGLATLSAGGWVEVQDENGELFKKQGIHGKRGLAGLFQERPDIYEFLKKEVRAREGWDAANDDKPQTPVEEPKVASPKPTAKKVVRKKGG